MEEISGGYERRKSTQELYKFMGRVEQHLVDSDQRQDRRDEHMKVHCESEDVDRKEIKDAIVDIQIKLEKAIICPFEDVITETREDVSECKTGQENHIEQHKLKKEDKKDRRGWWAVILSGGTLLFIFVRDIIMEHFKNHPSQ